MINPKDGIPFSARIMAGMVEIMRSSTTRSFIRATYARRRAMALDYPANPLSVLRVLYGSDATLLITRKRETHDTG
jgi:hypothetical protein